MIQQNSNESDLIENIPSHPNEEDDLEITEPKSKRFRKEGLIYNDDIKSYETYQKAEEVLLNEKMWKKIDSKTTNTGKKQYFKCNFPACSVRAFILHDTEDNKVIIFRSNNSHENHEKKQNKIGLDQDVKDKIKEYYTVRKITKPSMIQENLKVDFPEREASTEQIKNYLYNFKNALYGSPNISLGDLEQWCQDRSKISSDMDQIYVKHKVEASAIDSIQFYVFATTKRLISICKLTNHILADFFC